jgi:hypothetical protein
LLEAMVLPFLATNSSGIFCCENDPTEHKMINVQNNTILFMVWYLFDWIKPVHHHAMVWNDRCE